MPRTAYLEVEAKVCGVLDELVGNAYRVPRYYGSKETFGDLDVLVNRDGLPRDWSEVESVLFARLGIEQHQRQSRLLSTVVDGLQVDFFLISGERFLPQYHFMSFNDLGNIVGRMVRKLGLKYGEDGLSFVFRRQNGNYRRDILVSEDPEAIFSFLGLDPQPWRDGFFDLEAIFQWVTTSPYFSAAPYLDPGRTTRKKAQTRPTMIAFVAWLEAHPVARSYEPEDPEVVQARIAAAFPAARLLEALAEERRLEANADALRAKFNGELVRRWRPELVGKELGEFIRRFRERYPDDVLMEMPADRIEALVRAG